MSKQKQEYIAGKITIQKEGRWPEIKEWREFQKEKEKIKERYPSKPWEVYVSSGKANTKDPYSAEWWDDWCKYKKEITDLLLEPYGNFSKFLYKIRPERDDAEMRIWLRGRYDYKAIKKEKENG
jgi:hypothetical protein